MKSKKALTEEYKVKLQRCVDNTDREAAHSEADDLLVALLEETGFKAVTKIFAKVEKWYA